MQILVFKTNIRYKKQLTIIQQHIAPHPGILKWNVDTKDIDKVLRVEAIDLHPSKIETLVKKAGYFCEELKD